MMRKINLQTGEGFEPAKAPTGFPPVRTSARYEQMITHAKFDKLPPPSVSQKQMRVLADLWDKSFIHFEQGALPKLQEATKEFLQPNQVWRSFIGKRVRQDNDEGKYNRAEEHLAQLLNQTTPREKVNFESQYRVVQDNAIYELVSMGLGRRDATTNEEPIIVMDKYRDKSGAEHNIYATLNPIVLCYDPQEQLDEYNHFAERAKLPPATDVPCREFKKNEDGEVIYKVSIGTPLTGEHEYHEVPRSQIPQLIGKDAVERIKLEADKRNK